VAAPLSPDAGSAAGMLALAQKLHDQYVAEGREESDRIISEARSSAEQIVSDAEGQRDATLKQLNDERGTLEHKIDELREYERSYRQRMKDYLEKMLSGMDSGDASEASI
ncbi:MAG: cell division protein DivIVA, partial [Ruaniaceae bacterium]|nr:cell division protein DivIVA [Ruaniaceae bacterium]